MLRTFFQKQVNGNPNQTSKVTQTPSVVPIQGAAGKGALPPGALWIGAAYYSRFLLSGKENIEGQLKNLFPVALFQLNLLLLINVYSVVHEERAEIKHRSLVCVCSHSNSVLNAKRKLMLVGKVANVL